MKCEFTGCKAAVAFASRKKWTKDEILYTCEGHKPGRVPVPGHTISDQFYAVSPVAAVDHTVNIRDLVAGVNSVVKARRFIDWCCHVIGAEFHPNTPFNDYMVHSDGATRPLFTPWQAEWLERSLACCFTYLDDVYGWALGCEPFKSMRNKPGDGAS